MKKFIFHFSLDSETEKKYVIIAPNEKDARDLFAERISMESEVKKWARQVSMTPYQLATRIAYEKKVTEEELKPEIISEERHFCAHQYD